MILAVMIADYVFTGQKVFTADGILLSGTIGRLDAVILILLFIAYLAFTVLMALKIKWRMKKLRNFRRGSAQCTFLVVQLRLLSADSLL